MILKRDFNCDSYVNAADAGLISGEFKQRTELSNSYTNENQCNGHFDCDEDADNHAFQILKENYGGGDYTPGEFIYSCE